MRFRFALLYIQEKGSVSNEFACTKFENHPSAQAEMGGFVLVEMLPPDDIFSFTNAGV